MLTRRRFISQSALTTGALLSGSSLIKEIMEDANSYKLTILHTNDVHSRIDPYPMDGSRNQGLGGVIARSELIEDIRKEQEHILLLDAGDIFHGTPYFNLYKGEPEIKAMASMNYDASTVGNHDFDAGLENLANQLTKHANFPMLICNYNFTGTPMEYKHEPYKIFKKGKLKIGVLGVGIELKGLVPENLAAGTVYLDPVQQANQVANVLKKDKKCDFIICLSHLGYQYRENTISDVLFAEQSENIDLIIGGHTHTFMNAPVTRKNKLGKDVVINQVGFSGIILGRLDFDFSKISKKNLVNSSAMRVIKKTI